MMFLTLLISLILAKDNSNKTFVISLNNIDSSKELLQQIYEKAEALGFDFSSLASTKKSGLFESFMAQPAAEGAPSAGAKGGAGGGTKSGGKSSKSEKEPAAGPEKKADTSTKAADKSSKKDDKLPKTTSATKKSVNATSKSIHAKSTSEAKKSRAKSVSEAKASKSRSAAARKSASSRSIPSRSKSAHSRSSADRSARSRSSIDKSAHSKPTHSRSSFDRSAHPRSSIDKSAHSKPSMSASKDHSSKLESSIRGLKSSTMSASESMGNTMDATASQSVPSSISAPTASASLGSLEEIDKINGMDQSTIDSIAENCKNCAKVEGLLVYKDGNVWRDYSGKIEMQMKDGKLVDKTGVFMGKDCGCKKEEIPEMGKVTETGLYQDKQMDSSVCAQQNNLINELAHASSAMSQSASVSDFSQGGASTTESTDSVSPSVGTSSVGGDATSSAGTDSGSVGGGDSTSTGGGDSTSSTGGDATSSAGADSGSGSGGDSTSTGGGESVSSVGGGDATSSTGGESTPTIGESTQSMPSQPASISPTVSPVVFKAIKLKYDLTSDETCKEDQSSTIKSPVPSVVQYKTQTVTIVDHQKLPPETICKTITRMVVPETVSKIITQILRADPVTITEKPDTVIRYSKPKTITKVEKTEPVTVTKNSSGPELDRSSEDITEEPVKKTIKKPRQTRKKTVATDDVVTVDKTVTVPYKGVECAPDCPCESDGSCDNPCMEIKCEIVE